MQKVSEKSKKIDLEEYNKLKAFYLKSQKQFKNSQYFKRRLYLLLTFIVGMFVLIPFVSPTEREIDLISTILSLLFMGMLVLFDQLIIGAYYFNKEIK